MFGKKKADAAKPGTKYYGSIVSIPGSDGFGFIGIQSVTTEEGGLPVDLQTQEDIFLHQDDCASQLRVYHSLQEKTGAEEKASAVLSAQSK